MLKDIRQTSLWARKIFYIFGDPDKVAEFKAKKINQAA